MSTTELDTATTAARTWRRPRYDVSESEDAFQVRLVMPGVSRKGVDVQIEGETLSITGIRTLAAPEGWRPLRRELPEGDYKLNFRLNVPVNESKITARVEAGVLDLTLPKADEVKPRKIQIQ